MGRTETGVRTTHVHQGIVPPYLTRQLASSGAGPESAGSWRVCALWPQAPSAKRANQAVRAGEIIR